MKQFFAFLIAAFLTIPAARAQLANCATPGTDNNFLGIQTIRLWPGAPPQANVDTCNDIIPTLDQWPSLLENWLRAQGLLTVDKSAVGSNP
jgi:hypothetical protein